MTAQYMLQIHHNNEWHDAAPLIFHEEGKGIGGRTSVSYDSMYFYNHAAVASLDKEVVDLRALSVNLPIDLDIHSSDRWPAFMLDLLPQGVRRRRIVQTVMGPEQNVDASEVEVPLLIRSAGSPIGNIRIKESWDQEQQRLTEEECTGVTTQQILDLDPVFLDIAERFALLASGSSGVQGEWPKVLMTKAKDDLWYPDPMVADDNAKDHAIIKMTRSGHQDDAAILSAEAPYLEVARQFGVRVARPLVYGSRALIIPRFDREVVNGQVLRHGQESIVAAFGVAEFQFQAKHEDYLGVIKKYTTDPATEITDYVLRDILNYAMGNPDNHGRNTALQKRTDGTIQLTPLYDFTPMKLDPAGHMRSTKWECMKTKDSTPNWRLICEVAAADVMNADVLFDVIIKKIDFLKNLPGIARQHGVPEDVIKRACSRHAEIADSIAG